MIFPADLPRGIRNIAIINTLLLAWFCWNIWFWVSVQKMETIVFYVNLLEAAFFLLTGPLIFIRSAMFYRLLRPTIYIVTFLLSAFLLLIISKGSLLEDTFSTIFGLVLILYLIGERGYLNEPHVKRYYGADAGERS
jgi:hypothetical protein